MAAIYSNGGNRWNILGFNFTKRDALSSVYKISMVLLYQLSLDYLFYDICDVTFLTMFILTHPVNFACGRKPERTHKR